MIAFDGRQVQSLLALLGLVLGTFALSARYYTSASFEHPFIFSISSLLSSSLIAAVGAKWRLHSGTRGNAIILAESGYFPKGWQPPTSRRPIAVAISVARPVLDLSSRVRRPFASLVFCLVVRSCLFWYTMRRTQCAQVGVSAFLPFCVLLIDAAIRYWSTDYTKLETFSKSAPRQQWKSPVLTHGLLSLAWSVAAMLAVDSARVKTGTICLVGKHMEAHTPFLQVVLCVMDGIIIAELSSLRRGPGDEPVDISEFFSAFCLVASGLMAISGLFFMIFSTQQLHLSSVARRDLVLDTLMASVAIACAKTLLTWLHPTTVAMLTTGLTLFGYRFRELDSSSILPPLSQAYIFQTAAMTTGLAGAWFAMAFYSKSGPRSPTTVLLHRCLVLGYMAAVALFITFSIFFSTNKTHVSLPASVRRLTHAAQSSAEIWQSQAKMSKTLDEAVTQYQNRHFLPPPPNFDKWYEFAVNRSSQVIDSFGQIFDDLIPYWGLEPAEIRARTAHLVEFPEMGMAALQIRNGTLRQSPHIPGTHHWMTDSIEKMMEPFIQYLPDMDFVINLADECRVLPPYEDVWDLRSKGRAAQNKVAQRWKDLQENTNVEGEASGRGRTTRSGRRTSRNLERTRAAPSPRRRTLSRPYVNSFITSGSPTRARPSRWRARAGGGIGARSAWTASSRIPN
uniref:Uncharacterized protein n=1 Tax=Bionectria ochroleuca TaxID=29856 RepID=A0A8H7N3I3_BIOOC